MSNVALVDGYEGHYQVSDDGQVMSIWYGKPKTLKQFNRRNGYLGVGLCIRGKSINYFVHTLVAKAFCPGYHHGLTVNHKNLNKQDNRAENLEWVTASENIKHARRNGRCKNSGRKKVAVKGLNQLTGEEFIFESLSQAARSVGARASGICHCCAGRAKSHMNHVWSYA
jgi:hypothetical protein